MVKKCWEMGTVPKQFISRIILEKLILLIYCKWMLNDYDKKGNDNKKRREKGCL